MSESTGEAARVTFAWGRIEAWLSEHAPGSYRSLRAPAREGEIAAAEAEMGIVLPEGLKALLRLRDGAEGFEVEGDDEGEVRPEQFLDGYALMSLEAIVGTHSRYADPEVSRNEPGIEWCVPWAATDDRWSTLTVDAVDGPGRGQVGAFSWGGGFRRGGSPSVAHYLDTVADALAAGTGMEGGLVPGIALGCLQWQDPGNPIITETEWVPLS
ncbi:SMI1/KNR4 family protein [Streptomyces sp. NPDC001928]|uniref:SMI1/KNR4 family protein n=1 Tax=Streptomyces sp. NPDC001928 TaxID=3154404 RepID=UPI00332F1117